MSLQPPCAFHVDALRALHAAAGWRMEAIRVAALPDPELASVLQARAFLKAYENLAVSARESRHARALGFRIPGAPSR